MRSRARSVRFVALACAASLLLVACGDTDTPEENVAEACDQRIQSQESLDSLRNIDPATTTVDEVQANVTQVEEDVAALQADLQDVGGDVSAELDTALGQLRSTVDGADEETLADTRAAIEADLDELSTVWDDAVASLECE
jgi:chromosome segregation ATPase